MCAGVVPQLRRQRLRRFREVALGIGQAGVGVAGNREARHFVEGADVIGHQVRPGGAIHAHGQQVVIGDGGVERVDGLAGQHGAGAFDGDRGDHGNVVPEVAAQLVDRHQAGLQAAGIEAGLDEQIIGAAFD